MRTLKTLLCLSALAAGIATSVAQNVYSLNIVGYVNAPAPIGNYIYVNPLDKDGTNSGSQIFSGMPDGTYVNLWTGGAYDTYYYDASLGIDPRNWYQGDGVTGRDAPLLPPGRGFFMNPPAAWTNTYVGNVFPGPNQTNSQAIVIGNQMIGSRLPVGGSVTNAIWQFAPVDGTYVNKWLGGAYDVYYYDASLGIDPGNWYQGDGVTGRAAPSFNVGEGFFLNSPAPTTWVQGL